MLYLEQSDALKTVLRAAGVHTAHQLDIVDGQLLVDGVPHALTPSVGQTDVLRAVLRSRGLEVADLIDIVDGQLLVDGVPHHLVPADAPPALDTSAMLSAAGVEPESSQVEVIDGRLLVDGVPCVLTPLAVEREGAGELDSTV